MQQNKIKFKYEVGDLIQTWAGQKFLVVGMRESKFPGTELPYGEYNLMSLRNSEILWYNSLGFEKQTRKVA